MGWMRCYGSKAGTGACCRFCCHQCSATKTLVTTYYKHMAVIAFVCFGVAGRQ
jgi:hypothetical protein